MSYILEPEVAGGWGNATVADTSCHPPKVSKLVYEFAGWSGDDLLATFPCFIVSQALAALIKTSSLTGVTFAPVNVTKSVLFQELYPNQELPEFKLLQVHGVLGESDFAINRKYQLVVSEAAFDVIKRTSISQCEVLPC